MNITLTVEKFQALSITDVFSESLALFKKNPEKLLLSCFIGMLVSVFSIGILFGLILLNLVKMIKDLNNSGLAPEVTGLFERLDRIIDSLILSIIGVGVWILIYIPFLILNLEDTFIALTVCATLTIPILILSFHLMVLDEGRSPVDCFTSIWNVFKEALGKFTLLGLPLGITLAIAMSFDSFLSVPLSSLVLCFSLCVLEKTFERTFSEVSEIKKDL